MSGLGNDQEVSPEAVLAYGRSVLAAQPFSVLIGAELHALAPGHAELQLPLGAQLKQQHGFAHGGIVSYMADNALTFAGGSALRVPVVTSEFKINYVRPAIGQRLIARARAVHTGSSQAVCTCEVVAVAEDGTEKLCALAQGTIATLPDSPKKTSSPAKS
ncbi:PaaI family thioesterase [Variovorax boronicumulans]|uniref:PaaI family thioesterase n=1 Tax=Variovorax boronicumulans TaxID=436515 RepID=UPI0012E62949|nr:PaaI family thioesterase [Variovorax boronicumulans]GER16364.1 PaaI family thioesterase [Variovorax boronicumulans]